MQTSPRRRGKKIDKPRSVIPHLLKAAEPSVAYAHWEACGFLFFHFLLENNKILSFYPSKEALTRMLFNNFNIYF